MAKISVDDVKSIIDTDLTDADIQAYVDDAYDVITDIFSTDKPVLQRWLAAHLIATSRERQIDQAKAGPASATYSGKTGTGLATTTYGQQALALDPTGKLAARLGRKSASVTAVKSTDWNSGLS
jgi:hypothetical protein